MATVTSAPPMDLSRHMSPSSPSSSSLERTISASSSATVHPLDSSSGTKEEKASSSASSSPHSSSSIHKTISTAVSSINTNESLSSPNPLQESRTRSSKRQSRTAASATPNTSSSDTATNDYSWNAGKSSQDDRASRQGHSEEGQIHYSRRHHDRWSYDQSQDDEEGLYSNLTDEETPMQYPPISEEEKEARAIELNLERWASEEKLRRKAQRTSRIGSSANGMSGAPGMLTKRLSVLGKLGPSRGAGMNSQQREMNGEARRDGPGKRASWSQVSRVENLAYESQTSVDGSVEELEEGDDSARRQAKGKAREGSDPFRDPSSTSPPLRKSNIKPTSRAPIVTPGSAPTIRHRAIERALKQGGTGQMPSIVATDDDEEREAVRHLQEMVIDPFQSASEVDQHKQYLLAREAAKRTLLDGDGGTPIIKAPPPIMPPIRKSVSSSKFNEIGLDDDNHVAPDWLHQSSSEPEANRQEEGRKSWWTDWLCGCAGIEDEDGEQSGRTFPE